MKAKLLAVILAAGVSHAAVAHGNYNGWAVGLNGGWVGSSVNLETGVAEFDGNKKFNQTDLGLHADWNKSQANGLLLGLGFRAGYHFGNPSKTIYDGSKTANNYVLVGNLNMKQKRKFFAEIAARLGMNFGNSIAYALLAVKGTQVETEISGSGSLRHNGVLIYSGNGSAKESDTIWGLAPGAGFDFKINQKLSFGVEYRYFFEQSAKAIDAGQKVKMRSHNAIARLSYHF